MLEKHAPSATALEPSELQMLQRVFDEICERRGFVRTGDAAAGLTRILVDIYQHGVRTEQQLMTMLSDTKGYP